MNPSAPFILRPVATSLLTLALLLVGLVAYKAMPISALPQIDYPSIQVVTLYPGASPEVITSSITAPLERQFGQMPGLRQMSSSSSGGASVILLQFSLRLNLDIAEQEVQAAINAATTFLPTDLPTPPIYSKVNPADAPIITLAISAPTLPLSQVEDIVDTRIVPKLAQLPGVGLVSINGGQRPAVRIQANPTSLAAYGLGLEDLRTAITSANVNQPKGLFDGPLRASTLAANDQLRSAAEYEHLIIAYRSGRPIRLSDVAKVVDSTENQRLAAWADNQPAVIVNIQRQPGSNIIEVVDRIKALLPQLQSALAGDTSIKVLSDRTRTIRESIHDVQVELMFAVGLVVLVIFLFLRKASATAIPALAVPLSLIGSFAVMYLAGFSINNLTLMALVIATGFVVDDAIVVIENITRYIERGESPLQAALKGSAQIGFTIISLTLSLVAVLIPLLFMSDVVGRLFREFAVTLAVAILISGVISLTLTPMLCAKLLRNKTQQPQAYDRANRADVVQRAIRHYGRMLDWVLARQGLMLGLSMVTVAFTVLLYILVPKGFFPVQDTGLILGITEAQQSVSFASMAEHQQALAHVISRDPAVESLSSFIGVDGTNTTLNSGRLLINLKPLAQRDDKVSAVIARLQKQVEGVPGIKLYLQPVQDLTIESRLTRTQYQLALDSSDPASLSLWTRRLQERLAQLPQLADVASDLQDEGLQAYLEIDRDSAGRLGITPAAIDNALYDAYGQRLISTIFTQSNQYRVVLEVQSHYQEGPIDLNDLRVPSTNGTQVPLAAVARLSEKPAPLVINHMGQFPAATISFNLAPGSSLGAATEAISEAQREIALPLSIQTDFQGAALAFRASLSRTLWLILAAVVTVYIVLGVLYESYIHPLTILSTLPSAGVGALLALMLSGTDLGIVSIIGIILLIGIVKKNAIMMIDFALDAERDEGKSPREAIHQACLLRFRPIMMTTLAALLGALPLMLGTGVGSELRHPLGITLVGGLLLSQILTLFTTPANYLTLASLATRFNGGRDYAEHTSVEA